MLYLNNKRIIWGFLYWISLVISMLWVFPIYFSGLIMPQFDLVRFLLAAVSVLLFLIFAPPKNSIITFFIYIILYVSILPMAMIFACTDANYIYFISVTVAFIFVEQAVQHVRINSAIITLNSLQLNRIIIAFAYAFQLLTTFALFRQFGIPSLSALDFNTIYEIRETYSTSSLGYRLFPICVRVVNPFLFTLALRRRDKIASVWVLVDQFIIYLWLAHKTILFSIMILPAGFYLAQRENRILLFSRLMTVGVTIVSALHFFKVKLYGGFIYTLYSLIVRRAIIVPALIKQYYYDYFVVQNKPLAGFYGTILAPFLNRLGVQNPYSDVAYTKVIGELYVGGANANTGIFGRELAHFGYLGIPAAALLLVIFLACIEAGESRNGREITCGLAIYVVLGLADSGSFSMLSITPMLLIALLLFFFDFGDYRTERS